MRFQDFLLELTGLSFPSWCFSLLPSALTRHHTGSKNQYRICMLGLRRVSHEAPDFILRKRSAPPHMTASAAHVLIDERPHEALFKALTQILNTFKN